MWQVCEARKGGVIQEQAGRLPGAGAGGGGAPAPGARSPPPAPQEKEERPTFKQAGLSTTERSKNARRQFPFVRSNQGQKNYLIISENPLI